MRRPLLVAATALLVACSSDSEAPTDSASVVTIDTTITTDATDSTITTEVGDSVESPDVTDYVVSTEAPVFTATLGEPVDLDEAFAVQPDGTLDAQPVDLAVRPGDTPSSFLVLRNGIVVRLAESTSANNAGDADIVLDISDSTRAEGERGLLGLTFSDDGTRAWINHTDLDGNTRIVGYEVAVDGTFDESSAIDVDLIRQPYPNHNGGEVVFDGARSRLLVLTGDGGAANDPDRVALDPDSPLGKILSYPIDSDGLAGRPEVVAVGLRNPWRAVIHGDSLWIADVGQGLWEEVDVVELDRLDAAAPVSFGWSAREGTHDFNADQNDAHAAFVAVDPISEYEHVEGRCSISGGAPLAGAITTDVWYVFADFCTGEVLARCLVGCERVENREIAVGSVPQAVAVLPDHRGNLWVLGLDGLLVPVISDP